MEYTKKHIKKIVSELTPVNRESMFDEMLDETSEPIEILGMKYCASRVLSEVDKTAYRCCVNDYIDGLIGKTLTDKIEGEHYSLDEVNNLIED